MVARGQGFEMLATTGDPNRSAVSVGIIRAAADRVGGNVGAPQCRAPLQIVPNACQTRRRAAG
jgi:hypothetical protein